MNKHREAILAAIDGGASTEVTKAALAAVDAVTEAAERAETYRSALVHMVNLIAEVESVRDLTPDELALKRVIVVAFNVTTRAEPAKEAT